MQRLRPLARPSGGRFGEEEPLGNGRQNDDLHGGSSRAWGLGAALADAVAPLARISP